MDGFTDRYTSTDFHLDANGHGYPGASDGDSDIYSHPDGDRYRDKYTGATNGDLYLHRHPDNDGNLYTHLDANGHHDGYSGGYGDSYSDTDGDGNTHGDGQRDADSVIHANGNTTSADGNGDAFCLAQKAGSEQ